VVVQELKARAAPASKTAERNRKDFMREMRWFRTRGRLTA
jgi:hypothetical protein